MQTEELRNILKNLPAKTVAEATGIHENTIFRFRRGGNIGVDNFDKLVKFINSRVDQSSVDQSAG